MNRSNPQEAILDYPDAVGRSAYQDVARMQSPLRIAVPATA